MVMVKCFIFFLYGRCLFTHSWLFSTVAKLVMGRAITWQNELSRSDRSTAANANMYGGLMWLLGCKRTSKVKIITTDFNRRWTIDKWIVCDSLSVGCISTGNRWR